MASPANLHATKLASIEPRQLTNTLDDAIEPSDLVQGADVRYPSFDGLEIPAILLPPKNRFPRITRCLRLFSPTEVQAGKIAMGIGPTCSF